ncbi:MAG: monovalent cation/H+ antiporter complex subunit F [Anaerolineae bacterium]
MSSIQVFTSFLMTWVMVPFLALSIVVTFVRFVKGPSLPDRIVAIDILSGIAVAMMAAYAVATGETVFLDVALVVSLITFLGTIGFAYYIDRRQ